MKVASELLVTCWQNCRCPQGSCPRAAGLLIVSCTCNAYRKDVQKLCVQKLWKASPPRLVPGEAKLMFARVRRPRLVELLPTEAVHAGSVKNQRASECLYSRVVRAGGGASPEIMRNCGPTIFSSLVCALMSRCSARAFDSNAGRLRFVLDSDLLCGLGRP